MRLGVWFWPNYEQFLLFIPAPIIALPIFIKFKFYRSVVRYMGYEAMVAIFQATGLLVLFWSLTITTLLPLYLEIKITLPQFLNSEILFPRTVPFLFWVLLLITVGGSRQLARQILLAPNINLTRSKKNILIYGAGMGGVALATSLARNSDMRVLGFIDDDSTLKGHFIQNLKVLGGRAEIENIRAKIGPLEVLLAMPNMNREKRKELLRYLEHKKVTVRTIPTLHDIAVGGAKISNLQEIDITELLGREQVMPNQKLLTICITNKNVMVTGAGGSIGSELCRQILQLKPSCIVLLEHSEHNLYLINLELTNLCKKLNYSARIIPILGSITSKNLVKDRIKNFKIDTIYHAAAYKHVALLEDNIWEAVTNNIFGTYYVAQTALELNVKSFILISTDKAVRPTSIMGATKRIAELVIQGLSQKKGLKHMDGEKSTHFVIVRFGNVLGSSGSVIPLFKKQIESGGPITITHPEATRYFMTISEASQLVIQASSMGNNCNIFILNMGEPVSILNLAKQMVYLSGHTLRTDETEKNSTCIDLQFTGLQKGEKIHEELFISDRIASTEHPMIMKSEEILCSWPEVEIMLAEIKSQQNSEKKELRQLLTKYSKGNDNDKSPWSY